MTDLYSRDWSETRRILIAEHRYSIEEEPKRLFRAGRTLSAMLFGLAKRLSPIRRLTFLIAFVWFFACLFVLFTNKGHPVWLFAEMAGTFIVMTILLAMELIGKIKYRDELTLARDLQSTLIPREAPKTDHYSIAAFNHIANTVGGDLYDFVPLADGRIAILFGDASGHGMAAGLVMAVAHAAFRTQLDIDPSPSSIVGSLNRILCRTGGTRSFFACCYVLLSTDGTFFASVAGHPPILRVNADGAVVQRIGAGAYPLGIKGDLQWSAVEGEIEPGELLVLHSDGLTEARDTSEREFGDERVQDVIAGRAGCSAASLVDSLVFEWRSFTRRALPDDDVSIAVIQRT